MLLVLGDLLVDKYLSGSVNRISPEAPIPVVNVKSERLVPGGAANVTANLLGLKCDVRVCGIIGSDACGSELIGNLRDLGADVSGVVSSQSFKTLEKVRIVGNRHQIVRLDFNEGQTVTLGDAAELKEKLLDAINGCKVAIVSDYAKGVCNATVCEELIRLCKAKGIPVIVDPKGVDWEKYRGADWITPNFDELRLVTSQQIKNENDDIAEAVSSITERFGINSILATRSEQGMTLFTSGEATHIRARAQEVFDVSGAGDTVVAAFAAALAAGKAAPAAAHYANVAAAIVVSKVGTYAITKVELEAALRMEQMGEIQTKIMDWDTLKHTIAIWRKNGQTVCVTNGCFDVFHKGHASLILAASKFCDRLIVAINSDASVKKLKGDDRPVNAEQDRAYVLASLKHVDAVAIFEQDTPEELLEIIRPDVLVKGGEYTINQVPGRQYSGRVELVEYVEGYSTTSIVNKVKEGT